jgi:hypothetical protein
MEIDDEILNELLPQTTLQAIVIEDNYEGVVSIR